jgi:transcriptional regulator with XRE-family HTH domain
LYQKNRALTRPYSLPYIFRKLRIHRNLSRKSLAKKSGFSEQYITGVEDGSRFASVRYCLLCAELFNANPAWVKGKWAHEAIERFSTRVNERLGLNN